VRHITGHRTRCGPFDAHDRTLVVSPLLPASSKRHPSDRMTLISGLSVNQCDVVDIPYQFEKKIPSVRFVQPISLSRMKSSRFLGMNS
jgi:hypothetical protein